MRPLRFLIVAVLAIAALFALHAFAAHDSGADAKKADYIRYSKPDTLTFDELVELEKDPTAPAPLEAKLQRLLTTPFINNEAYYEGAKPKRPSSPELGPYLRAVMWNIERGFEFDEIRTALSEPDKFDQYLPDGSDPKEKALTPDELKTVRQQLDILQAADLLIFDEVDNGVTRTDYRDVARDFGKALR
jgi:hypothetical protein